MQRLKERKQEQAHEIDRPNRIVEWTKQRTENVFIMLKLRYPHLLLECVLFRLLTFLLQQRRTLYLRTRTAFFRYFYIVEGFFASSANRNCCLITVWLTAKYGIKVKNKGFSGWVSYFVRSPLKRSIFMFSHMIIELCKAWMLMQWEIMKLYLRQHFSFHFQPNGNARWMKNIAI